MTDAKNSIEKSCLYVVHLMHYIDIFPVPKITSIFITNFDSFTWLND